MINKEELNIKYANALIRQKEFLKKQYEFYFETLKHTEAKMVTDIYFYSSEISKILESVEKIKTEIDKLTKEKEEGEKENGKTKLNA